MIYTTSHHLQQKAINYHTINKYMYLTEWFYLLTYSTEQSPSWEVNQFSASQKIPQFYGTWRFITTFTSVHHLSLSWTRSIQSITSHPTSWKFHLHLDLTRDLFPSGFPTKTLLCHSSPQYPLHAPPISFFSILSPELLGGVQIIMLLIM